MNLRSWSKLTVRHALFHVFLMRLANILLDLVLSLHVTFGRFVAILIQGVFNTMQEVSHATYEGGATLLRSMVNGFEVFQWRARREEGEEVWGEFVCHLGEVDRRSLLGNVGREREVSANERMCESDECADAR